MLYLQLRHFVQEWIEIARPSSDNGAWPWRNKIYLINLYPIPISESIRQMPPPFVSILVERVDNIVPLDRIYRNQYRKDNFNLPRRYLYNPMIDKDKDITNSRYSWTCNTYRDHRWEDPDIRLIRHLSTRPHVRHSAYNSSIFSLIDERLASLSQMSDGAKCNIAENLFDCTSLAKTDSAQYPETMVMGVPIMGVLAPIKKSRSYKILNGCLVITQEPITYAVNDELSYDAYAHARKPFVDYQNSKTMIPDETKTVAYIAVNAQCGSFSFTEYIPRFNVGMTWMNFRRMLTHHFTLYPYQLDTPVPVDTIAERTMVMVKHDIIEGVIPDIKANEKFYGKPKGNLFARSDLPRGYFKSKDGVFTSYEL